MPQPLLLASSSQYRQQLLNKLQLKYSCHSPDIDESAKTNELPQDYVLRLAKEKAQAMVKDFPQHLIIASDQCAVINGKIIGKPHTAENAIQQLSQASGQKICFYTGLVLLNAKTNMLQSIVEPFYVHFRRLTQAEISNYIAIEQPLNCAGSFKSEGLGISLFEKLEGEDPNSLIGLPLIKLMEMLRAEGINPLL